MNDARRERRGVHVSRNVPRPKPKEAVAAPPHLDEEFGEFFNKGDAGEYEGGVAYSQPPSKQVPELAESSLVSRTIDQRARRARFARLVGLIVTGCVVLLVAAVQFKPRARIEANNHEIRQSVPLLQRESAVARLASPVQIQVGHSVNKPVAVGPAAELPLSGRDAPMPAASARLDRPGETPVVVTEPAPTVPTPAAIPQLKARAPHLVVPATKVTTVSAVVAHRKSKASSLHLPDKSTPIAPSVAAPVRKSVVAFPVD